MRILWSDMMRDGGLWHIARCELGRRAVPAHDHDYFEFFWVEEGQGTHHFRSRRERLEPGHLCFILPHDYHKVTPDPRLGLTAVNVALEADHVRQLERRYGKETVWPWRATPAVYALQPATVKELQALVLDLATMDQRSAVLDGVLLRLLGLLERDQRAGADAAPRRSSHAAVGAGGPPRWLADALDTFAVLDPLEAGPRDFARLAHRTPEHVNRTMHAVFGCTTTDKLNALRMERAAMLLRMAPDSILDICYRCGFSSLSHFYACFRSRYGATPRGYRMRAASALAPDGAATAPKR